MSRARLYVLIDAFEHDLRVIADSFILDHIDPGDALGGELSRVEELRAKDEQSEEYSSLTQYLYLQQCMDVLNRHRKELPAELAEELRHHYPSISLLAPIRNRVMHGRPLKTDDPEMAVSRLSGLVTRHWKDTKSTLHRLAQDPSWEPAFETLPRPDDKVLHNLPHADFDETGLVGRSEDSQKLKRLLLRRREPIITLTGEGGIGKTALALDAAYNIVDDEDTPYDCVLWVSLKAEVLTAYGVKEILNAVKDMHGITQSLGRVIDKAFSGDLKDLADILADTSVLIIIDNLETAQGTEVMRLYDALPDTVNYLFTSRIGIGELERRYPLGPLSDQYASVLFRKFARSREQSHLAQLSPSSLQELLQRLRFSPLAIRWYILSVEAGAEPLSTIRNQSELINFCVLNVYESMSDISKTTLGMLRALDRAVSFDELAVLTEMPVDDLRLASQEMSRGSLIVNYPDPDGGLISRIGLSSAARAFLPLSALTGAASGDVLKREQDYLKSNERRRSDEARRRLGPNVVRAWSAEDEPIAHLLRSALTECRKRRYDQAQVLIDRARSLNPDYWEVDRVDAFVASQQQHRDRATTLYRQALDRATTDEAEAVVSYFYSGHLARSIHDTESAIPYAERAHNILGIDDTGLHLGNLYVWQLEFERGQNLIELALDNSDAKTRVIARTTLVESWRRWAESLLEDRMAREAFDKAITGVEVGLIALGEGYIDRKLANSLEGAVITALRAVSGGLSREEQISQSIVSICQRLMVHRELLKSTDKWRPFVASLESWSRSDVSTGVDHSPVHHLLDLDEDNTRPDSESDSINLLGTVISLSETFGFIEHIEYPKNVFFHRGVVAESTLWTDLRGRSVMFSVELGSDGRHKARRVSILPDGSH